MYLLRKADYGFNYRPNYATLDEAHRHSSLPLPPGAADPEVGLLRGRRLNAAKASVGRVNEGN